MCVEIISENIISENNISDFQSNDVNSIPKCSPIYISTKTKISYLNHQIPLSDVFWRIPVIDYYHPTNGVVKKQMKFNSTTLEELEEIHERKKEYKCVTENIIYNSCFTYIFMYILQI